MGAVDTPESGVKHKKGRRRKPKRIGIKIDMTPMRFGLRQIGRAHV